MIETRKTTSVVLLTILYQLLLSIVWGFIPVATQLSMPLQLILSQILAFLVPVVFYFIITKKSIQETLRLYPLQWKNVILIIVLSLLIQPLMGLLSFLATLVFPNSVAELIAENTEMSSLFVMIISVGIMPAICEEVFFRGVIFSGYRFISTMKACCITGLLFGITHMDAQQFLYTFALGSLFCVLVYRTNSILASMTAHFTINASQILLAFRGMNSAGSITEAPTMTLGQQFIGIGVMAAVTLPLLTGCIWLFFKLNPKPIPKETLSDNEAHIVQNKVLDIPFMFIIVIYILIAVIIPFLQSYNVITS